MLSLYDYVIAEEKAVDIISTDINSDEEVEDLSRGEQRKQLDDNKFLRKDPLPKGSVLAPPLEETFSFASPSTSATNLTCKCPPTSSGNDLTHMNPYGVSPCVLLTALTLSNATDGMYGFLFAHLC